MPSIGFRTNRPARLDMRANGNHNHDRDDMNLRSPNRQSIQQLTHQQLVTRQRQLLLRPKTDHAAQGNNMSPSLATTASSPHRPTTLDPKASTCSVNTIVNTIESKIERVDIGKTIELLQELKKSATADELVALHRALLPVKHDKPTQAPQLPPIDQLAYTSIPSDRTRSSIPPGLATRSGGDTDPLRKPSDPLLIQSPPVDRQDSWVPDLDGRRSRAASPERLSTPPEQTSYHGGAYQAGTLRITNGAASPEPSIISKLAMEVDERDVKAETEVAPPEKDPSPWRKRMTMAVLNPSHSPNEGIPSIWRKRSTMALRSEERDQCEVTPAPVLPKLDFVRSRDDLDIKSPRASMIGWDTKSPRGQLLPTLASLDFTKDLEALQVVEPRAQSFNFGVGEGLSIRKELQLHLPQPRREFPHIPEDSTEDVPRFQQRWGHRAARLSNEYTNDCGITPSPYEEKRGLLDFATRLSTVCDEDEEGDEGVPRDRHSHADTLSKLTGGSDEPDVGHARSSDESDSNAESPCARRGTVVRKVDSGYCSDASAAPLPHISSGTRGRDVVVAPTPSALSQEPGLPSTEPTVTAEDEGEGTATGKTETLVDQSTLYAMEGSPGPQSEATMSPSPKEGAKRSPLSLFRPGATRKKGFTVINAQKAPASPEDISRSSTFQSSDDSPLPLHHKKSKKLQKAMPESVRHQRKKTMESIQASHAVQAATPEQSFAPDGFTGCQPRDEPPPKGDDGTASLFSRKRGKSFGRKRSKTGIDASKDVSPPPSGATTPVPSSDRHRRRSKSIASIAAVSAPIPRWPSEDVVNTNGPPVVNQLPIPRRDASLSARSDFASVAGALTSHPPDATSETTPSAAASRRQHKRYYSMHRASSDGASSTGGHPTAGLPASPGAAQAASIKDTTPPGTPREQMEHGIAPSPSPVAVGSNASVEDRFPGWEGKPATDIASQSPAYLQPLHVPRSRNNSVPALPELPADIAAKVAKADEMVAKKLKNSPRPSPIGSARTSIDHNDGKKPNSAKKRASPKDQARQAALDKLTASYDRKFEEPKADVSVKELTLKTSSGHVARWSIDGSIKLPHPDERPAPTSPTHDSRHPGWPGWEKQSSLWRHRRQAMVEPVTFEESISVHAQTAPAFEADSPSIVVSRYVGPLTVENVHIAATDDAWPTHKYAQEYSDLIVSDLEDTPPTNKYAQEYSDLIVSDLGDMPPKPEMRRADSAFAGTITTATFVTVQPTYDERPAKVDIPRSSTALSTSSCTTTTATVSTASWAGSAKSSTTASSVSSQVRHERTKSGHFKAFRPTDASQAERSRALSVARRSAYLSGTESWGHLRNESLGLPKSLRADLPSLKNSSSESVLDRYCGGHGHGAFGGSAGTGSSKEPRDGKCAMGEQFGLDLSDVPTFLRKV